MAREFSDEEVFGAQASTPAPAGGVKELSEEEVFGKPKDLSWTEVAKGAVTSAPGSALEFGKALVQPFIAPIETATSLKNLGMGVAQKLGIAKPGEEEKYADALGEYFKERYGGLENIKRTFATDPVGFLADASTVFTGGGTLAAKAPGVVGQIGRSVATVGSAIDPLAATARGIGAVGSKVMSIPTETVEAAGRLGVQLPAAAAAESSLVPRVAGALKEIPVAGYPLAAGSQRAITQLENAVDNVVQQLGSGRAADAGDLVRQSTEAWIRGKGGISGQIQSRLYDAVDNFVTPQYYQHLNATTQAVADIMARRTQARISGTSKAVDEVLDAVKNPAGINYPGLKDLRTSIGTLMKDKDRLVAQNIDAGELKLIYGALSDDLKNVVQGAGGPDALKAFERANKVARLVTNRREELSRLLGVTADASAEQIIQRVADMASGKGAKGNLERLVMLKKSVPADTWAEMSSAVINKMGRAAEDAPFSGARFVTSYENLSDRGRQVLFGSTPWLNQAVNDIYQVSQAHKRLMSFGNPSGTGRVATLLGSAAGFAKDPISTLASLVGGATLAQLLATPVGARSVTRWGRAYEAALALPSPGNLQRLDAATRAINLSTEASERQRPQRATGGSVLDPMKKRVPQAPPTWTTTNKIWNALTPYQKAAAMALMEADKGNVVDARNALGAMVNRAARSRQDLGAHVSQRIYQPTIEPTQQNRLPQILKSPAFQELTQWAERRTQGYEPDPVNGATHFLAPEKTMLTLQQRDPDKYHNWGPFKNSAGRPGNNWSKYNPETGQYENVVTRDSSHAFVAPEGRFSAPYRGSTEGAPAPTTSDQEALNRLIADEEKRAGMDRLASDAARPQNVQSLASSPEDRQALDRLVGRTTGPSEADKSQLNRYIQGLMTPEAPAPMPALQPVQLGTPTPIAPVTPYDPPRARGGRAEGGSVLDRFKKKDDDDWRSNYDLPGPQDPRRQDEIRATVAPRWEELLPGRTVSALNQNPIFQAIQRFTNKGPSKVSETTRLSPLDMTPMESEPSAMDRLPRTVQEGIGGVGLLANFLAPGVKLPPVKPGIRTYHGSPHDFPAERLIRTPEGKTEYIVGAPDKLPEVPKGAEVIEDFPLGRFRDDKIGSGEGAQVYGRGHYSAEKEEIGKGYRDALAIPDRSKFSSDEAHQLAQNQIRIFSGDLNDAADDLRKSLSKIELREKYFKPLPGQENRAQQVREALSYIESGAKTGRMYELNIKASPDQFLDWDMPLGQQNETVRQALGIALKDRGLGSALANYIPNSDRPGMDAIGALARGKYDTRLNVPEGEMSAQASEALRKAGVPGIRYKDASSRGAEGGTYNYVVFDPSIIQIMRKYGIAGTVMGGGLMFTQDELQAAGVLPQAGKP